MIILRLYACSRRMARSERRARSSASSSSRRSRSSGDSVFLSCLAKVDGRVAQPPHGVKDRLFLIADVDLGRTGRVVVGGLIVDDGQVVREFVTHFSSVP